MELTGATTIAASREAVWQALNDPDVLARCIDGVESLTRVTGEDGGERFEGRMNAKVGPVRATFSGAVRVTEAEPPRRWVLAGEGKGGVAGFAKGSAEVVLEEPEAGTTALAYTVRSTVGGKLAQLGGRLIEGAAKSYADTFFSRLRAELETPAADEPAIPPVAETPAAQIATVESGGGIAAPVWGAALVVAVAALLIWLLT